MHAVYADQQNVSNLTVIPRIAGGLRSRGRCDQRSGCYCGPQSFVDRQVRSSTNSLLALHYTDVTALVKLVVLRPETDRNGRVNVPRGIAQFRS